MPLFKRAQRISFSQEMWAHPIFLWTIIVSLILVGLMVALATWKLGPIGQENTTIPLHYNVYFGVDLVGPWYQIFFIPILGFILLAANILFARLVWSKEHLLSFFFATATLVIEAFFFVSVVLITLLNL